MLLRSGKPLQKVRPLLISNVLLANAAATNYSTRKASGGRNKGSFPFKTAALVGVGIGAVGGGFLWAYYDPEIRKEIEKNIPRSKEVFSYVYETLGLGTESEPMKMPQFGIQKKQIPKEPRKLTSSSEQPVDDQTQLKLTTVAELSPQPTAMPVTKKEAKLMDITPVEVREPVPRMDGGKKEKEADALDEVYESKLFGALKAAGDEANKAKDAKFQTIKAIQAHSRALKEAVDSGSQQESKEWERVKTAAREMENCSKKDSSEEAKARTAIEALKEVIRQGRLEQKKTPTIQNAIETVKKLSSRLNELNYMIQKEQSQGRVFSQYKELVQQGREQWAEELKSAFPDINLHAKEGSLTEDELNAFIVHATMRIDQLKRELAEYQTQEEQKIAHAIEEQRKMDEKLGKLHMDFELQRIRNSEDLDLDAKISEERVLWEAEVEEQLKRAAMAHAEHLEKVIRTQKQLHDIENAQLVQEAVNIERNKFGKQIGSAVDRLNTIEQALNSRSAQDLENRRAKIFWTVCLNLMDTLLTGDGNSSEEVQMATKLKEVKFIRELTENDEFAQSICDRYPKRALEGEGVPTETGLKKRFDRVYKLARRCAQIDENGGGLFDYFLSLLQSAVTLDLAKKYSAEDKIDTQNYEPYELLGRIRHFVGEGDLASAVRLANLLRGESAQIFRDWISDAQLHLEARLLTDLLLCHAQVTSVRTTY